jgi:hypothetical protein
MRSKWSHTILDSPFRRLNYSSEGNLGRPAFGFGERYSENFSL